MLLRWDAPDETVDSWQVLRRFRPAETVHTVIATVDGQLNEWTDTELTGGDRSYKVAAVRDSLTSQHSQVARLVIDATPRATPGTITQVPEETPTIARGAGDTCTPAANIVTTTLGTATNLASNQTWVQVTLASGTEYQIDVSNMVEGDSTIKFVCGPDQVEIANTFAAPGTGLISRHASLKFTPSATGLHDVKITTKVESAHSPKTVRVVDLSNDCSEDMDTTCTAAVGNAAADAAEGTIDFATDYDWVKVPLVNGRSYRIDLRSDGHPSIDPWIVDIYDKRGDKITRPVDLGHPVFAGYADHDSGPGNAARVIYPATETGNHFIKVASRGSASQRQGAWHLQVTEASAPYYDDFTADTSTTGTVTVDGTVSGWIDATPSWYDAGDTGGPSITVSGTSREPGWTYDDSVRTNCHEATGDGIKLDGNTCDRDWFAVNLTTNLSYKLQLVSGTNLLIAGVYNNTGALIPNSGSIIDSIVFMTDEDPSESVTVVFVDDFVVFRASRTGTHYIAVTGRSSCSAAPGCTGRYTLSVTQQ